jgi:hypothetical protein
MSPTESLGVTWPALTDRVESRQALDRWAAAEPVLAGIASLDALAEIVHHGQDPARADELLGGLVRLAAADGGDDEDAALVLAHLLDNGTHKLALQLRDLSTDIDELLAGELWLQIRAFPWRRRRRAYAKSLLLDTRLAVLAELRPYRTRDGHTRVLLVDPVAKDEPGGRPLRAVKLASAYLAGRTSAEPPPGRKVTVLHRAHIDEHDQDTSTLLDVLEWAQRSGVIDRADAALLLELVAAAEDSGAMERTRLAGRSVNRRAEVAAVAARHGVVEKTIWRRRARALTALQAAGGRYLAAVA